MSVQRLALLSVLKQAWCGGCVGREGGSGKGNGIVEYLCKPKLELAKEPLCCSCNHVTLENTHDSASCLSDSFTHV